MFSILPALNVSCSFFQASSFASTYGLPNDLTLYQVEGQADDWGLEPQWAALVNVWAAQFMDKHIGRINCFADSNYGAIMRQVGQSRRKAHGNMAPDHAGRWKRRMVLTLA